MSLKYVNQSKFCIAGSIFITKIIMFTFNIFRMLKGYMMRIQSNFDNSKRYKLNFKSLRSDKIEAGRLKNGNEPLIENNKRNICGALNNLAGRSDRESMEFLLDTADNLAYGQSGESEFKKIIDSDSNTQTKRENTDWHQLLSDTIKRALDSAEGNIDDLKEEYKRIFSGSKPLTQEQKDILDLRSRLADKLCTEAVLDDSGKMLMSANIRKNLDYFISSSEISYKQKKECLEKFLYLLSDDYKINPQLSDKKIQVLDEMLNDLVIQTPESEVLTIKDTDQKYTGMCAAISICRKAMAYEDKTGYTNLILEELKDSPEMEVYDVTELGTGRKVSIPKINIDYDTAVEKGYRIVDASAHNWMNNAHAGGDGTIQTEKYSAFDEDSFGIYDDTSWYENLETNSPEEKNLLKALIKEKEALSAVIENRNKIKSAHSAVMSAKKETVEMQSNISASLRKSLKKIFPDKSDKEITQIEKGLYSFYTGAGDDNEINVPAQLPAVQKKSRLERYLKADNPDMTEEEKRTLSENIDSVYKMVDEYTMQDKNLKKLQSVDTRRGKYDYYKKLYNLGAAHRLAVEADVNMPDGVIRFERISGLPVRETQVLDYMQTIKNNAESRVIQNRFKKNAQGGISAESLADAVVKDMLILDAKIPAEVDNILKALYGQNMAGLASQMYERIYEAMQDGSSDKIQTVSSMMDVKNDKKSILDASAEWKRRLENSPSRKEINEAVRLLGCKDSMQFASSYISAFIDRLQADTKEENTADDALLQCEKFLKLQNMRKQILEKWQVPAQEMLIMERLEKAGSILTAKQLKKLQSKFEYIQRERQNNSKIKNIEERKKADNKLYVFSSDEMDILSSIEKAVPQMKKYSAMEYQAVNKCLKQALDEQYSDIGMLNGQFWVREEGSTGLTSNEQIRIFEQMTGKPYHIEYDIQDAVKQIKKGGGSGIISMSISDSDYAFHAQYVPFVSASDNKKSGLPDEKTDVIWMDNSWGRAEKDYYWKDENGLEHTDYGAGYGWKDGFILDKSYRIGLPVKDIIGAIGTYKGNAVSDENTPDKTEDFGLFTDVILPGVPPDAYQKLYKMIEHICTMREIETVYDNLEEKIKSGAELDLDLLTGIDETASASEDEIYSRLDKEIKTKEDYDSLDENDNLKFIMDKLALYMSTSNPVWADNVLSALSREDLEQAYTDIREEHLNVLAGILGKSDDNIALADEVLKPEFEDLLNQTEKELNIQIPQEDKNKLLENIFIDESGIAEADGSVSSLENFYINKTVQAVCDYLDSEEAVRYFIPHAKELIKQAFDENIRINSLDSPVIEDSPLRDEFLEIIDKYFNPKSDEEMLSVIQDLQEADNSTVDNLFNILKDEEIGINIKPSYDYVIKYKEGNMNVLRELSNIITAGVIYSELDYSKEDDDTETPDELFRTLLIRLSDLDVQKHIKSFKAEAFQKYQVRQAFPDPKVLSAGDIADVADSMFGSLKQDVESIKYCSYYINVFESYEEFEHNISRTKLLKDIKQNKNKPLKDENQSEIELVQKSLTDLQKSMYQNDDEAKMLLKPVNDLLYKLQDKDGGVTCRELNRDIKSIKKVISDWEISSFTKEKFIQTNKETLKELRSKIKLIVNTNVQEKYRNDLMKNFNKLTAEYRKDADEEHTELIEQEIINDIIDKHIVKNPVKLLEECVKDVQNGNFETEEYKTKKTYLKEALKVAQQTRVQYNLVQNQHEAIGSKLKDMLSMFYVTLSDGRTIPMSETEGMVYLVENLKNPHDGSKTLNLFLKQSGLSQQALKALVDTFDINKSKEMTDEKYKNINRSLEEFEKLSDEIYKFINSGRINYKSFPELTEQLKKYMMRRFSGKENAVAGQYIDYLNSMQFEDSHYRIAPSMIPSYFNAVNNEILQSLLEDNINNGIKYIEKISEMLAERIELMNTINVPETSETAKKRDEIIKLYEDVNSYISEKLDDIENSIKSSNMIETSEN